MDDQPSDSREVTNTGGGAYIKGGVNTSGGDFVGRDKNINIFNYLFGSTPETGQYLRARRILLENVNKFWVEGVLKRSLHNEVLLTLALEDRPSAVDNRSWDMVLQTPQQPDRPLPPGTKIIDAFDQQQQSLLILGAPGSGKTTMLLDLASTLIKRAEADPAHPIPVIFNLAFWALQRQPIHQWLVTELAEKYSISNKIAYSWIENDNLLLLLDGLDEVKPEDRDACVTAINTYRQEHLVPLAICSRIDEYKRLETKLQLCGAVYLCPLSPQQIDQYFVQVGLDSVLNHPVSLENQALLDLVRSPLMLNILTLVAQGTQLAELHDLANPETYQNKLLSLYIHHMLERRGISKNYSSVWTLRYLAWLAHRMLTNTQAVFLIEKMQPNWLNHRGHQFLYKVLVMLVSVLPISLLAGIGVGVSVSYGLSTQQASRFGVIAGSIYLLTSGLFVSRNFGISGSLVIGLTFGLAFFVTFAQYTWLNRLGVGALSGLLFGGSCVYVSRFKTKQTLDEIAVVEELTLSWPKASIGAASGLLLGFAVGLLFWWANNDTIAGKHLLIDVGIAFGSSFAVAGGITVGLLQGLMSKDVLIHTIPNQGIFSSAKNAIRISIMVGSIFCILFGADAGFVWYRFLKLNSLSQSGILAVSLIVGFTLGPAIGILLSLIFGGLACIQHLSLRLLLYINGRIPWDYARFLDYCADRIFLRKVGGGYIFIHRLLMEHFAALTEEDIQRLAGSRDGR